MIESIAHYKILDRIGTGGLGDVYRARDTRHGRTVAVKLPGTELQTNLERRDALVRDARAAASLSHPNIATLYEIGEEGGRLFLVFEFVPGDPLTRVIAGRPLNPRRAVDLAAQIADALAEGHAVDIAHGDLRSDTVMVTPKGNAKLLDFGLSRWTRGGGRAAGSVPAKPASDPQADLMSLGTMLVEMLTGKPPAAGAAVGLPVVNASAVRELDDVVAKAIHARPDARYEADATFAAELRAVAAILDVRAVAADPVKAATLRRPRPSRRRWVLALLILVMLAALAVVWWLR